MAKRIYAIEDLCSGCQLCQMVCSFLRTKEYNRRKALIRIFKVYEEGINTPLIDCDGTTCPSPKGFPKCVEMCPTGALIFAELDEVMERRRELVNKRTVQPIFKVIAPWKWPLPWKEWPYVRGERR